MRKGKESRAPGDFSLSQCVTVGISYQDWEDLRKSRVCGEKQEFHFGLRYTDDIKLVVLSRQYLMLSSKQNVSRS